MRNRNEIDRQKDKVYEDPSNHQATFEHEDKRDGIIGHRGKGGRYGEKMIEHLKCHGWKV